MPKTIDHNKRRKDIIDNSFQLFAELGYAGLSMRKMAKHMGMTTGMLYHYFANKEELFTALLMDKQIAQIATFNEYAAESDNNRTAFVNLCENLPIYAAVTSIALSFIDSIQNGNLILFRRLMSKLFNNTWILILERNNYCLLFGRTCSVCWEKWFSKNGLLFQYL